MTTASQKTRATRDVPAMASRHFWFIADTLRDLIEEAEAIPYPDTRLAKVEALHNAALTFARRCRGSNSQFKEDRFLEACGVREHA